MCWASWRPRGVEKSAWRVVAGDSRGKENGDVECLMRGVELVLEINVSLNSN